VDFRKEDAGKRRVFDRPGLRSGSVFPNGPDACACPQIPHRGQTHADVSRWPYAAGRHTSLALELKESDVPGPW
jgi:hypothetical protein